MKKVWVTALVRDEEKIGKLMGSLKQYGLAADGHFWVDDLKHMAWQAPAEDSSRPMWHCGSLWATPLT